MKSNLDLPNRRSIRLRNYGYPQDGAYFVTLCVKGRECLLGEIERGVMRVNQIGSIAADGLQWLSQRHPYVDLDEWVVMPNHIHAIILIDHAPALGRGGSRTAPTEDQDARRLDRCVQNRIK